MPAVIIMEATIILIRAGNISMVTAATIKVIPGIYTLYRFIVYPPVVIFVIFQQAAFNHLIRSGNCKNQVEALNDNHLLILTIGIMKYMSTQMQLLNC